MTLHSENAASPATEFDALVDRLAATATREQLVGLADRLLAAARARAALSRPQIDGNLVYLD